MSRIDKIKEQLTTLNPSVLNITDDSHQHVGHPGAQSGKGHFSVEIACKAFEGKSKLECHRLVYATLADLMESDIHALRIIIK